MVFRANRVAVVLAAALVAAVGATSAIALSRATDSLTTCAQSISAALLANRISAQTQSYRRDNPAEYARVRTYLDGGPRPPTTGMTHMGLHLVYLKDTCVELGPTTTTTTTTTTPPGGGNVVLTNRTFECSNYPQPVNFNLVRVTNATGQPQRHDGFHTGPNCTGRIGRIELVTPTDGMKIQPGAHDLVIEGGFIHCLPVQGEVHQDGIQAQGGTRVTLRNLDIDCGTNSAMFINEGAGQQQRPTDIVCENCTMRKLSRNNRTLRIFDSLRSGARNSTIYWAGSGSPGPAVLVSAAATSPINQNNTLVQYGG